MKESILSKRIKTKVYDPVRSIDESYIFELVRLACLTPSAYNLQNWDFIAIHSKEAKQDLYPLTYNQAQILDASVTFIVCGRTNSYDELSNYIQSFIDKGVINLNVQEILEDLAAYSYRNNSYDKREDAIRSASLASMSLMVAAQELGLTSGVTDGFNPDAVKAEFLINEESFPVMLVTVGYPKEGNERREKARKSVSQVLTIL